MAQSPVFPSPQHPALSQIPIVPTINVLGEGSYGKVTQVLDSNGALIAARKTMKLCEGERISEHECHEEFHLLKLARDERAPNILYALPLGKTSLLDVPKGDLLSHTIYFDMEVATGRDLRRYLLDHSWK